MEGAIRQAAPEDVAPLARLWHAGWQDAHADILPEELARHRTLENFEQRLRDRLSSTWAHGAAGAPDGFYMLKDDELYQFYVDASARGTGLAARLIEDAERRIAAAGHDVAWLACAIGNARAARFYEKSGWRLTQTITSHLPLPGGEFSLDVWRYEKALFRKS